MLVRPLMFSASLLYSQEMVPNSFSCAQLEIYSTELPKRVPTRKITPMLLSFAQLRPTVSATAPAP